MKEAVDACVSTHVRKCPCALAHTCARWGEPLKKRSNEMAKSEARCQGRKRRKMKGRRMPPAPHPFQKLPWGGRPPDGSHLQRLGYWSHHDAGAAWLRGHAESGASDPEGAISATI